MKRFIEDALYETNTSVNEYGESKIYTDAFRIYLEIWRTIVNTHENYFWDSWTTDIQEGANEYELERLWTTTTIDGETVAVPGIDKVKRVYILQGDKYVEIPQLSDYQDRAGLKGWTLKDNHIILSWIPEENVENGLKLEGTITPNEPDMSVESTDDMFPGHEDLLNFMPVLSLGLKVHLWRAKQDFDKANLAKQEYQEGLMDMRRYITERVQDIYYTNLTY